MEVKISHNESLDIDEVLARSPVALQGGARLSLGNCICISDHVWTGAIDDTVVCVWGLISPSIFSIPTYLWLLTTEAAEEHKFIFIRQSRIEMAKMLERNPIIIGHVQIGDVRARRWLKWLGAKFGPYDGWGIPFRIEKWTQ